MFRVFPHRACKLELLAAHWPLLAAVMASPQLDSTVVVELTDADDQATAVVTEPAAQQEPPLAAPPPADPLEARREAEYDLGIRTRPELKRPSRPPPGADRRGLRVVSSRGHNPFPSIPESPESQSTRSPITVTRSGMVAVPDSGIVAVAVSSDALAMVSTESPDSPERQSSSRAEGEGRGGLAAASVHSSALDAVSSAYARVIESDPARMPTPAYSAAAAAAAAAATAAVAVAGEGGPPPAVRMAGGMAAGRPAAAKGARVTTWSEQLADGGPAVRVVRGDGGDGGDGEDGGLGSEAEELLRMVEAA